MPATIKKARQPVARAPLRRRIGTSRRRSASQREGRFPATIQSDPDQRATAFPQLVPRVDADRPGNPIDGVAVAWPANLQCLDAAGAADANVQPQAGSAEAAAAGDGAEDLAGLAIAVPDR